MSFVLVRAILIYVIRHMGISVHEGVLFVNLAMGGSLYTPWLALFLSMRYMIFGVQRVLLLPCSCSLEELKLWKGTNPHLI